MRFYTESECEKWLKGYGRALPSFSNTEENVTVWYPPNTSSLDFVWIAELLNWKNPILLWINEWGIWPSSENWHLYYRLRESYGDRRELHEAPGHLFLEYETYDLASFLQVAVLNGWGGYLLPTMHYGSARFSHDEYLEFYGSVVSNVKERFADLLEPPGSFQTEGRSRYSVDGKELSPSEVKGATKR